MGIRKLLERMEPGEMHLVPFMCGGPGGVAMYRLYYRTTGGGVREVMADSPAKCRKALKAQLGAVG